MPSERINTRDTLEATVTDTPAMPTEGLSEEEICGICGARMSPGWQLTLNETPVTVMVCTGDPSHTKNLDRIY